MSAHFTWGDDPAQHEPFMVCDDCGEKLCSVEEGDALDVIVSVAADHACDKIGVALAYYRQHYGPATRDDIERAADPKRTYRTLGEIRALVHAGIEVRT